MNRQPTEKNPSALWKILAPKLIIAAVILVVVVLAALGFQKFISSESKTTKIGFEDIGELATQVAYCTEVNVTEASRDLWGITIPFTQSKYIYSYDVVVKAGFDFSQIEWELDETNHVIEVRLPEAAVLSREIVLESFKLYHEDESIFRQITMEENNAALAELEKTAEENAIANGLLDNARTNAETLLTAFFSSVYDPEVYTFQFAEK